MEHTMALAEFSGFSTMPLCEVVADQTESSERREAFMYNYIAKACARDRAEEVQRHLDPMHPSFVKSMVPSEVDGSSVLHPPARFCKLHLPKEDAVVTLVDENEESYTIKYLGRVLSAGWKTFSTAHNLVEGDVLVFELVKPAQFQVYIIRAYSSSGVDGCFGLQNSKARTKQIVPQIYDSTEARSNTIDKTTTLESSLEHNFQSFIKPTLQSHMAGGSFLMAADQAEKFIRAKTCARERAEEVQRNLDPQHPSFVKSMVRTTVTLMCLPAQFCNSHLRKNDIMITLVDEDDNEYKVKFINKGFVGGWRRFSAAHNIVERDALVFQLVNDVKFQVYIIRAYSPGVDGLGLQNSEVCAKQIAPEVEKDKSGMLIKTHEQIGWKRPRTLLPSATQLSMSGWDGEGSQNTCEDHSEDSRGIIVWGKLDRKSFDVAVDGLRKKSKLSEITWTKYYELCHWQNVLLHENLLKHNSKLVDGIISETIIIADGIKASKVSTFLDKFGTWDRSLQSFEHLGMNVRFLRAKLQRLKNLISKSEHELYMLMCQKAQMEHARLEEMKALEMKLLELKDALKSSDLVEKLKRKIESHELKFQEELDTSW